MTELPVSISAAETVFPQIQESRFNGRVFRTRRARESPTSGAGDGGFPAVSAPGALNRGGKGGSHSSRSSQLAVGNGELILSKGDRGSSNSVLRSTLGDDVIAWFSKVSLWLSCGGSESDKELEPLSLSISRPDSSELAEILSLSLSLSSPGGASSALLCDSSSTTALESVIAQRYNKLLHNIKYTHLRARRELCA